MRSRPSPPLATLFIPARARKRSQALSMPRCSMILDDRRGRGRLQTRLAFIEVAALGAAVAMKPALHTGAAVCHPAAHGIRAHGMAESPGALAARHCRHGLDRQLVLFHSS